MYVTRFLAEFGAKNEPGSLVHIILKQQRFAGECRSHANASSNRHRIVALNLGIDAVDAPSSTTVLPSMNLGLAILHLALILSGIPVVLKELLSAVKCGQVRS